MAIACFIYICYGDYDTAVSGCPRTHRILSRNKSEASEFASESTTSGVCIPSVGGARTQGWKPEVEKLVLALTRARKLPYLLVLSSSLQVLNYSI